MNDQNDRCEFLTSSWGVECGRRGVGAHLVRAGGLPWATFAFCRLHRERLANDLVSQGFEIKTSTP